MHYAIALFVMLTVVACVGILSVPPPDPSSVKMFWETKPVAQVILTELEYSKKIQHKTEVFTSELFVYTEKDSADPKRMMIMSLADLELGQQIPAAPNAVPVQLYGRTFLRSVIRIGTDDEIVPGEKPSVDYRAIIWTTVIPYSDKGLMITILYAEPASLSTDNLEEMIKRSEKAYKLFID